jgi:hypothetical protein
MSVRRIIRRKRSVSSQRPQHNEALELFKAAMRILETANSQRRKVLSAMTVARILQAVRARKSVAWGWSSWTTAGYGRSYPATMALCFRREDGCIVFGAAQGRDKCASPGLAWKELQPWRPGTSATSRKLEAWANRHATDRLCVPAALLSEIIGLFQAAANEQKGRKDFSGNGMAFHWLRPGSKLFATNAGERMRWQQRRTSTRPPLQLSTTIRLVVSKPVTLPTGWKVVSGPPRVGLMIMAVRSPTAAPSERTPSAMGLNEEPSPFDSLEGWECHLQQLQQLTDDNIDKKGAIELARAMITRLRGRLH